MTLFGSEDVFFQYYTVLQKLLPTLKWNTQNQQVIIQTIKIKGKPVTLIYNLEPLGLTPKQ